MTTRTSRDLLDWYRDWARAKYESLGLTLQASNMNIPLNNDVRVRAAIDYLLAEEARLRAEFVPGMEAFWQAAIDEVVSEIEAQMPPDIALLDRAVFDDPDPNGRVLLKAFYRVMGLQVQSVRYAEANA